MSNRNDRRKRTGDDRDEGGGRNDDRPDAGGEGAGDQGQEECNPLGLEFTADPARVNRPPLSSSLRALAEKHDLGSLCPYLATAVPVSKRLAELAFFIALRADDWRKLRTAREEGRRLLKAGVKIGGDTLPPLLVPRGYPRHNNETRALLVAAVVCAWPGEFKGRFALRAGTVSGRAALDLIESGWRPEVPPRRRGGKKR